MRFLKRLLSSVGVGRASPKPGPAQPLKVIHYRGGVVTFSVPAHWVESYGQDGGAEFWDPSGSATMRLEVTTFEGDPVLHSGKSAADILAARPEHGAVHSLRNGNAMQEFSERCKDRGADLVINYWKVCNLVPPCHMRVSLFSYTVLQDEATAPSTVQTINLIRQQVLDSEFSPDLGV